MNQDFRVALTRDWQADEPWKVIDFTRYDLPAKEPADPTTEGRSRNWSLINVLNQKGTRLQDKPMAISELDEESQALIREHYPEVLTAATAN